MNCSIPACSCQAEIQSVKDKPSKEFRLQPNDYPDDRFKRMARNDYIGHYYETEVINGKCYFHNRFKETKYGY